MLVRLTHVCCGRHLLLPQQSKNMKNTRTFLGARFGVRSLKAIKRAAGLIAAAALSGLAPVSSLSAATWSAGRLPDLPPLGGSVFYRSPQFTVMPDGRFLYAHLSSVWRQNTWGSMAVTLLNKSIPASFDPAFIVAKDTTTALIGAGGSFSSATPLYSINPSIDPVPFTSIGTAQSYAAAYWKSPTSAQDGWLIVGQVGTGGVSGALYVSMNGAVQKLIVDAVGTYSSGMAVGPSGELVVAHYDFSLPKEEIYRFTAAQVEAAISGSSLTLANGTKVCELDSAGALAVDGLGRIWGAGFMADGYLEVFDPATGQSSKEYPSGLTFTSAGSVMFQPIAFRREGIDYVAFTARDAYDGAPEFWYGLAPVSSVVVPNSTANWRRFRFGSAVDNAALQATVWGSNADPDRDGRVNLLEYALGSDPNAADASGDIVATSSAGARTFSFTRCPEDLDLTYILEVSSSLSPTGWQEVARSTAGATTVSSGIGALSVTEVAERRNMRVSVTIAAAGDTSFARLRITGP